MSQPDLFVVCKNCGSEVSPYVTECPYCGKRVRKRAPKLERSGQDDEPRPRQRRRPRLPRLRAGEIEGVAPELRPKGTIFLIALSLLVSLALATEQLGVEDVGGIVVPLDQEAWRYVTTAFVHDNWGYQFVSLVAVGVFGSLLERRFGLLSPLVLFVAGGAAGAAAAVAVDLPPLLEEARIYLVLGSNGSALALLAAWLVDDRRAARRGDDRGSDLIGVWVFAAVLLLLPLAVGEASVVAGFTGAATGALVGLALPVLIRR